MIRLVTDDATIRSGDAQFTVADLFALGELVAGTWSVAAGLDWSVRAATLEWSCLRAADHAVDCVYAPAFFLASRKLDAYPDIGTNLTLGARATPERLVESLRTAATMLAAVVLEADPDVRAVLFRRPTVRTGAPADFLARGALELIIHAHDVCAGLDVAFDPPADLCHRLREHTRPWPMWTFAWNGLGQTDDAWGDLLRAAGRTSG
jgi:Mycothiol maleylpyruvate isomerase N-terminal domain